MMILGVVFNAKHFSALFLVIVAIVIGIYVLKRFTDLSNKDTQQKVLQYSAIAFLLLEAVKLITMINEKGSFPMNQLPLHLCSYPLYAVTIVAFSKRDSKLAKFLVPSIYSTVMLGGIITVLYPINVIGNEAWFPWVDNFIPLLSFIYHGLMIFLPVYLLISGYYRPRLSDTWKALTAILVLMAVAIIVNITLDQDYMLLNKGTGSPLGFLLEINQLVYSFSMILLGLFVISLSFIIGFAINRKL